MRKKAATAIQRALFLQHFRIGGSTWRLQTIRMKKITVNVISSWRMDGIVYIDILTMTTGAKENAVDKDSSLPKQDEQVKRSGTEQRRRKEDTAPYTAWVPRKFIAWDLLNRNHLS